MKDAILSRFDLITDAEGHIRRNVQSVVVDEGTFRVFSGGEKIAVALVLNRYDLLERAWGTMLSCVDRLCPEWTEAALRMQRLAWVVGETEFERRRLSRRWSSSADGAF